MHLPLTIIGFGIDELSKVLPIFSGCFAPLALAAHMGLGQRVLNASNFLRTDIVLIGVVAYLFDLPMRWLGPRPVPLKGRMRAAPPAAPRA